ncbi:TonB-dependent receptor [Aquimarina sp. I32.4]|uniref:SusC/RagA family TonB-linked outer membrane protein n=1 Tax=Aquimarina sp. I32.4 TaxID=2053903 RepID=UPI000CDEFB64|nr:TonB-dependent receptor [Aquimarina sp. I32.4]
MKFKLTKPLVYYNPRCLKMIMRTFLFFYCAVVFSFNPHNGFSQNTNIIIDVNKTVSVEQIFKLIKEQTEYQFVYRYDLIKDAPRVFLERGVIKAGMLLKKGLAPISCTYEFNNNTVIVKRKVISKTVDVQDIVIKGLVTDSNKMPLPGVAVVYKEKLDIGTTTDFDGQYEISIPKNKKSTLLFSSIGYITQEIEIQNQSQINVVLQENTTQLEQIVLVGYGSKSRSEVSTSISSVKGESIQQNSIGNTSFDRALGGLLPGVVIKQTSGAPGSNVDINIRGITSPFSDGDNNPLFVIDGVPFQVNPAFTFRDETEFVEIENPLLSINPNDIESIDVLKDAAATAIYGSRGANGVILVKTKKGKKNEKMEITFSTSSVFGKPVSTLHYLDTNDYKTYIDQVLEQSTLFANLNDSYSIFGVAGYDNMGDLSIDFGSSPFVLAYNGLNEDWFDKEDVNWADEVYRGMSYTQQHNLSLRGGNENTSYTFSLGHTNQEGLLKKERYKQYNFRLGIDSKLNKIVSVGATANIGYSKNVSGYVVSSSGDNLNSLLNARPDIAPLDANGSFNRLPIKLFGTFEGESANPLAVVTGNTNTRKGLTLLGNMYASLELFKGFILRSDVNLSMFSTDSDIFQPASIVLDIVPAFGPNESRLTMANAVNTNLITNITTNYSKKLEKHTLDALAGFAWDRTTTDRSLFYFVGFPDDEVLTNITNADDLLVKSGSKIETGLNSIFSRLSYNYANKYFMTVNFRSDKSIKFGPSNQRAYFPSIAASWDISKENFLINSTIVNNMRVRFGIGRSGSNNIGDFEYLQFFNTPFREGAFYAGNPAVGLTGVLPNQNIKWAITDETNFGLNFGLFNNRLRGSVDVYNRKTRGALMNSPYPLESGAGSFLANVADLTNKGIEIEFGGDIVRNKDLRWSANINLAQNKNTLDKFNEEGLNSFLIDFYEVGKEVNLIKGWVVEDIFQDQSEIDQLNANASDGFYQEPGTAIGDYKYVDLNGDGEITIDDRKVLGSSQVNFFGGFNTSIRYKRLEFSSFFNFSQGGEATLFSDAASLGIFEPHNNIQERFFDRWTPDNTTAQYPRAIIQDPNGNSRRSDRLVYDTSFLRLKSMQFKYDISGQVLNSLGLTKAFIYVTGSNIWTWTDFPGIDPEATGQISSFGSTNSRNPYPLTKTWSLGFSVTF